MKPSFSSRAPIWACADQEQTGFVGRAEFYNALRIVTVAQSKRELTPEMVKEALYGPAAAKIHAPKINRAATPVPQFNSAAAAPDFQGGVVTLTSSRNLGFRGPQLPPQHNSAGAARATQGGTVTPTSCQNLGSGDHKYNLGFQQQPMPIAPSHAEEKQQANQQKPRVPELEKHLVNQLSTEEVNSLNSKLKEATEANKKRSHLVRWQVPLPMSEADFKMPLDL
ncbi:hypothetical protein DVH24_000958 [Malus domestica]|uniref:EF-hand domain-containing protein n=1 Tax=Malus domestica TaxID=3750 RepID=A0A498K352_MALDO|nr:hypothetical protein DVH24_000958 [Malus domestica]